MEPGDHLTFCYHKACLLQPLLLHSAPSCNPRVAQCATYKLPLINCCQSHVSSVSGILCSAVCRVCRVANWRWSASFSEWRLNQMAQNLNTLEIRTREARFSSPSCICIKKLGSKWHNITKQPPSLRKPFCLCESPKGRGHDWWRHS